MPLFTFDPRDIDALLTYINGLHRSLGPARANADLKVRTERADIRPITIRSEVRMVRSRAGFFADSANNAPRELFVS